MNTKLGTLAQVALLREGDTIKRFPSNCSDIPTDKFDERRINNIDTYTIRSINTQNEMLGLVSITSEQVCASPGRVGRLFIKSCDLVAEDVWWV
jgi:hypothetical protein